MPPCGRCLHRSPLAVLVVRSFCAVQLAAHSCLPAYAAGNPRRRPDQPAFVAHLALLLGRERDDGTVALRAERVPHEPSDLGECLQRGDVCGNHSIDHLATLGAVFR